MKNLENITKNTTEWIISYLTSSDNFKCQLFDILKNEDKLNQEECDIVINDIENRLSEHGSKCYRNIDDCQFTVEK